MEETFSITEDRFGELVTIELKPGGENLEVTEVNKKEYVDCVVDYRISRRVKEQFDAFMEGLLEVRMSAIAREYYADEVAPS